MENTRGAGLILVVAGSLMLLAGPLAPKAGFESGTFWPLSLFGAVLAILAGLYLLSEAYRRRSVDS